MVNDADIRYMKKALDAARFWLDQDKMPVGAIVVVKGEIVGWSYGSPFTGSGSNHAEVVALNDGIRSPIKREDVVLYTTMEPCVMCMGTILQYPVTRVVYAFEDPHGGATKKLDLWVPPRHVGKIPEIVGGVLREESRLLLKQWFTATKHPYWSGEAGKATELYKMSVK
jgi:tRNA(adenine34) deaminase